MSLNTILATAPLTATGYHLKATGTALGQSLIWDNGTNVGIGNQGTTYTLDVSGTGRFTGALTLDVGANTIRSGNDLRFNRGDNAIYTQLYDAGSGAANGFILNNTNGEGFHFKNAATTIMRMNSAGNVGIGTSSPSYKLDIAGTSDAQMSLTAPSATGYNEIYFRRNTSTTMGYIGVGVNSTVTAAGDEFVIQNNLTTGNIVFRTNGGSGATERMRITSGGDVLIGKISTSVGGIGSTFAAAGDIFNTIPNNFNTYHLYDSTNSQYRFYVSGGGTINATNTTISAISDVRLKENITDLQIGLDAIMALKPRQFDWKKESGNNGKNVRGFIAQEFEEVFPDLIDESINKTPEGEPYKQIRQDLIPILVKAIQEQQAQIEELKAEIEELKNK